MSSEALPSSIGRYQVRRLLGRGGMGEVYLCGDPALGRQVAIKILPANLGSDEKMRARFLNEARAVAGINHPNVITIHDVGVTSDHDEGLPTGLLYLVLEYLEGRAVDEITEKRRLSVDECLDIGIQVLEGLKAAHQKRILHRDITPANIMIEPDGRVKILDFGLSKLLQAGARDTSTGPRQTGEGMIVGTLDYLSPEQALGNPLDERSDLFSFGIVFYQMLTGTHPFAGKSITQMVARMMTQEPHPIMDSAGVPEILQQILARSLRKNANERFGSAAQMMLELVLARRELGSMSRTDRLLGMSQRVAAADAAARTKSRASAHPSEAAPRRAQPTRSGATALLPRLQWPLSRTAVSALVAAALLVLVAVALFLLRARS
jgi:serine/threonine protein kinase